MLLGTSTYLFWFGTKVPYEVGHLLAFGQFLAMLLALMSIPLLLIRAGYLVIARRFQSGMTDVILAGASFLVTCVAMHINPLSV